MTSAKPRTGSSCFPALVNCCEGPHDVNDLGQNRSTAPSENDQGASRRISSADGGHQAASEVVGKLWQIAKTVGPPVLAESLLGKLHACVYEVQLKPADFKPGSKKSDSSAPPPVKPIPNAPRSPEPKTFVRLGLGDQQARTQSRSAEAYVASNVRRLVNFHELMEIEVGKGSQPQLSVHVYDEPLSGDKPSLVGKVTLDVKDLVEGSGMGTNLCPFYLEGQNVGHVLIRMWFEPSSPWQTAGEQ